METNRIMDELSFAAACRAVRENGRAEQGVGTLGEKTLHAVLKRMIEPDMARHEVNLGRYTADVLNEQGVFEVQTRNLHKLKPKLTALLPYYPVTVVVPIIETKWLLTLDPETGELTDRRKSPKRGKPADLLPEFFFSEGSAIGLGGPGRCGGQLLLKIGALIIRCALLLIQPSQLPTQVLHPLHEQTLFFGSQLS